MIGKRATFRIAAISPAAAAACDTGWEAVAAAPEPSDAALLSLAAKLCQSPRPK
jgi:uroporphyrinogen-III synthase